MKEIKLINMHSPLCCLGLMITEKYSFKHYATYKLNEYNPRTLNKYIPAKE